ncbi:alpha/beta hydrolase-fold protein [Fluviicola taffensis]|uniref:alpha/beta hydrolase-fold protein n=1 Tax=Fluviicola taffensis TaxID=191579 RepID=UPI0031378739
MKNSLIYLIFLSTSLHAQVDTNLVEVINYSIDSKILETERNYWVSLPSDYDSARLYPVIYVLDAESKFNITNALEKDLSDNGKIPQHIVVGITHPNRRLDMSFSTSTVNCAGKTDTIAFSSQNSGNGLKFFAFIEEELMQEVNLRYSTSGFNILIGHSLGGYFCSYILPLQKSFKSLQIYDPSIWYSKGEAIQQIDSNLTQNTVCHIFISSSSKFENQCPYHYAKIEELKQSLNRFPNIHYEYKTYENEHHNSMCLYSFLDGMSMLYKGYEIKKGGFETIIDVSIIEEHYKQFSKTIQFEFIPPINLYLEVGAINFHQKKYQNCIEALEIYLDKSSKDPYALELIGDAYAIIGKKKQSRNSYIKAYGLCPENTRLKNKIENL